MRIAEFAVGIGADMTEFEEEVKGISKTVQHAASSMVMPELSTTQIDKAFKEIKKSSTDALKSWSDFHNMADMEGSSKRWADYKRSVVEASGAVQSFGKDGGPAVTAVSGVTKSITGDFKSAIPAITRVTNSIGFIPGPIGNVTVAIRGMMSLLAGPGGIVTAIAIVTSLAFAFRDKLFPDVEKTRKELEEMSNVWRELIVQSNALTQIKINVEENEFNRLRDKLTALKSQLVAVEEFEKTPEGKAKKFLGWGKSAEELRKEIEELNQSLFRQEGVVQRLKDQKIDEHIERWGKSGASLSELDTWMQELDQDMRQLNIDMTLMDQELLKGFDDPAFSGTLQQLRDEWAETHDLMMVGIDSIGAGVRGMFDQFLGSHRQAKNAWDAIWISMKNTAVSALGELAVQAVKNFLIDKALQATATAATVASMATIAAAAAPAAALVAIATFGAASAIGSASVLTALGTVQAAALFKIPGLAGGGLAFGPQLAMVGDNPNARTDPEVIAPLSRLTDIVGSGIQRVYVTGRLVGEGKQLVGIIEDQLAFEER